MLAASASIGKRDPSSFTSGSMQPLSKEEVDRILDNNLEEEFGKLAATPGFVLKPMPFHQVTYVASAFSATNKINM